MILSLSSTAIRWLVAISGCWIATTSAADPLGPPVYRGKDSVAWQTILERDSDDESRRRAAYALGQIGPPAEAAVPALAAALESRSLELRHSAADALGRIGPAAKDAVPKLLAGLASPVNDIYFYRYAAKALGRIGPDAKSAEPSLLATLQHDDAVFRVEAAAALWKISRHESAVPKLLEAVRGDNVDAACAAVMAFHELGPVSGEHQAALVAALQHPAADVRRAAAQLLAELGPAVIGPVTQRLSDPAAGDRRPMLFVLAAALSRSRDEVFYRPGLSQAEFATAGQPILKTTAPAIARLLADEQADIREAATAALAELGLPAALFFLQGLKSDSEPARQAAIAGLIRIEQRLPDPAVQSETLSLVKQRTAAALIGLLRHEQPAVRLAAFRGFAELGCAPAAGPLAPETLAALRDGLKDENVAIRRFAAKAVEAVEAAKE